MSKVFCATCDEQTSTDGTICPPCSDEHEQLWKDRLTVAKQRIAELERQIEAYLYGAPNDTATIASIRADERRKVAEEILNDSGHYWDFASFIENTRNKYLGNKPVSKVKP